MRLKFFGLLTLLSSLILGGVVVRADDSVKAEDFAIENVAASRKEDSSNSGLEGKTSVADAVVKGESKTADAVVKDESWRKDVKILLYDCEGVVNGKNCEKTIEIQGIPDGVEVSWLRIWTGGCSMSGTSDFVDEGRLVHDKERKVWKATFSPGLDAKCTGCRNLCNDFDMDLFNGILFLYDEAKREPIDPLSFEVSNKGLKKPECLSDFKNFKLELFQKNDMGFLKICGIPANASEINVSVEESPGEGKAGPWNRVVNEKFVSRSEESGWNFVVNYEPKNGGEEKLVEITFSDKDGFWYLITEVIK